MTQEFKKILFNSVKLNSVKSYQNQNKSNSDLCQFICIAGGAL